MTDILLLLIPGTLFILLYVYRHRSLETLRHYLRLGRPHALFKRALNEYLSLELRRSGETPVLDQVLQRAENWPKVHRDAWGTLADEIVFNAGVKYDWTDSDGEVLPTAGLSSAGEAKVSSLVDELVARDARNAIIRGLPLIGKTTILRQIARQFAKEGLEWHRRGARRPFAWALRACLKMPTKAEPPPTRGVGRIFWPILTRIADKEPHIIPVFVQLGDLAFAENDSAPSKAFYYAAQDLNAHIRLEEFDHLLEEQRLVLLLDGLEDVPKHDRPKLLKQIEGFGSAKGRGNPIFLASRSLGFPAARSGPMRSWRYCSLLGLSTSAIEEVLAKLGKEKGPPDPTKNTVAGRSTGAAHDAPTSLGSRATPAPTKTVPDSKDAAPEPTEAVAGRSPLIEAALWLLARGELYSFPVYNEVVRLVLNVRDAQVWDGLGEIADTMVMGSAAVELDPKFKEGPVRDACEQSGALRGSEPYAFTSEVLRDFFAASKLVTEYQKISSSPSSAAKDKDTKEFWTPVAERARHESYSQVCAFLAEAHMSTTRDRRVFDEFEADLGRGIIPDAIAWRICVAIGRKSPALSRRVPHLILERLKRFNQWGKEIESSFVEFRQFLVELKDDATKRRDDTFVDNLRSEVERWTEPPGSEQSDVANGLTERYVPLRMLAAEALKALGVSGGAAATKPHWEPVTVETSGLRFIPNLEIVIAGEDEGPLKALGSMIKDGTIAHGLKTRQEMSTIGLDRANLRIFHSTEKEFDATEPMGGLSSETIVSEKLSLVLQPNRFLGYLAEHGLIRPIRSLEEDRTTFYNFDAYCRYGLYTYGYPFAALSMYVCYRRDWKRLEKPPRMMPEYYELAKAFTDLGADRYGTSAAFNPKHPALWYEWLNFAYGAGGRVIKSDQGWGYGEVGVNDRETVDGTVEYLKLLPFVSKDALKYSWDDVKNDFLSGRVFMCMMWTDQLYDVLRKAREMKWSIDYFPLPAKNQVSQLESWLWCVPARAPYPEHAIAFARWFSRDEKMQREYLRRGGASALKSVYTETLEFSRLETDVPYIRISRDLLEQQGIAKETIPESKLITEAILAGFEELFSSDAIVELAGRGTPLSEDDTTRLRSQVAGVLDGVAIAIARITSK